MIDEVKDIVQEEQNIEKEDFKDRYIHLLADYQNLQKRSSKEGLAIAKRTRYETFKSFIPIYNDVKFALKYNDEGVTHIFNKFNDLLEKNNIGVINDSFFKTECNNKFDDKYADAISILSANNIEQDNDIAQVIEDGFYDKLDNSIILHAKVIVFKH